MIKRLSIEVLNRLQERFENLYGNDAQRCLARLEMLVGRYGVGMETHCTLTHWDETDAILITYADMVQAPDKKPLTVLNEFLNRYVKDAVSSVHVLPFFPSSSDDGFSVIDYRCVDPLFGTWEGIQSIQKKYRLMCDLVINHVSRQSAWFKDFVSDIAPARHFFIEVDPAIDSSQVVRPRSTPLFTPTQTREGERHVWATFSDDQIDLNFANPDVLFAMLDILFLYISKGAQFIRLDAIAYLWKEIGTPCIHHPNTHEVVKLIRDILEMVSPNVLIVTETNVPHQENISYFGKGHEAHIVYQFSLPPLLLHGLLTGNTSYLTAWATALPALPLGCTFLNFTASHDGIGVRPLEGIVPENEINAVLKSVLSKGGHVSTKMNADGTSSPYELNCTYFDALAGIQEKSDEHQLARFLCSQTVALELKGIPAIYFHSLTATPNDHEGVQESGHPRSINRMKWNQEELESLLKSPTSNTAHVFAEYLRLLCIRSKHTSFHPNGGQWVIPLGPSVFALQRTSTDQKETIVCISNFKAESIHIDVTTTTSALQKTKNWYDLISEESLEPGQKTIALDPYQTVWIAV